MANDNNADSLKKERKYINFILMISDIKTYARRIKRRSVFSMILYYYTK